MRNVMLKLSAGARRAAVAAGLAVAATAVAGQDAAAQDRWTYRDTDNGALTRICASNDPRVCAVLFCAVTDEIRFALDGFREGGRRTEAPGRLTIDGRDRATDFRLVGDGRDSARLWVADVGDIDALLDDLSRGSALTVTFGARRIEFDFPLRGSSRAIRSLFATCSRQTPPRREEREPRVAADLDFERWIFRARGDVAFAQSCADGPRGRVCAVMECGRDGEIALDVRGHRVTGGRSPAPGRVVVDRFRVQAEWRRARDHRDRGVRRADIVDIDRLLDRIASGSTLSLRFGDRGERLDVPLNGSRAAVDGLRAACALFAPDRDVVDDAPPSDDLDLELASPQPWLTVQTPLGGAAVACTTNAGGREICAGLACDGEGGLVFGLRGPRGGDALNRRGAILIDGGRIDTRWTRSEGFLPGSNVWRSDVDNTRRLSRLLARGSSLSIEFGRQTLEFSLEGSGRAVRAVRRACDATAVVDEEPPVARAACALHSGFGGDGETLLMSDGQVLPELGDFDGRVRSVSVADGCRIAVFSNRGNRGFVVQTAQDVGRLPFLISNTVSSATCRCER